LRLFPSGFGDFRADFTHDNPVVYEPRDWRALCSRQVFECFAIFIGLAVSLPWAFFAAVFQMWGCFFGSQ
jgi:hypothetical protein